MSDTEIAVRVARRSTLAEGVISLDLVATDGSTLPPWDPGAHVDVMVHACDTRQYSLCSDPGDLTSYRIGVLKETEGRGVSRYIHDTVAEGDRLTVRGPRNNFSLLPSPQYLFIAGGIGITPILPMIRRAQDCRAAWRLTYGGRRRTSMAFLEEVKSYGEKVDILPQDEVGLPDLDTLLAPPASDTLVYCCGPEPLLREVEKRCATWPRGSLRVERFVAKPVEEAEHTEPFEIVLNRSGMTLTVLPGQSVLQVVRAAGVAVLSSCEEGTCGTCETSLLEGQADHRDSLLDDAERAQNTCMMICVSRARSPRLVLDL